MAQRRRAVELGSRERLAGKSIDALGIGGLERLDIGGLGRFEAELPHAQRGGHGSLEGDDRPAVGRDHRQIGQALLPALDLKDDFEVVFEIKGGQEGLADLAVVSPDGRTVVAFKAPVASTLGMRQFRFESPEPSDVKALQAAYPQGVYRFSGKTFAGAKLDGTATLSHRLAKTTTFVKPTPAAEHVSVNGLKISWSAVEGVASYVVSITQDELNTNVTARLPGSVTSFAVPDGLLLPGKKYMMSIGTTTSEGNTSFVETTFTTEK